MKLGLGTAEKKWSKFPTLKDGCSELRNRVKQVKGFYHLLQLQV